MCSNNWQLFSGYGNKTKIIFLDNSIVAFLEYYCNLLESKQNDLINFTLWIVMIERFSDWKSVHFRTSASHLLPKAMTKISNDLWLLLFQPYISTRITTQPSHFVFHFTGVEYLLVFSAPLPAFDLHPFMLFRAEVSVQVESLIISLPFHYRGRDRYVLILNLRLRWLELFWWWLSVLSYLNSDHSFFTFQTVSSLAVWNSRSRVPFWGCGLTLIHSAKFSPYPKIPKKLL